MYAIRIDVPLEFDDTDFGGPRYLANTSAFIEAIQDQGYDSAIEQEGRAKDRFRVYFEDTETVFFVGGYGGHTVCLYRDSDQGRVVPDRIAALKATYLKNK